MGRQVNTLALSLCEREREKKDDDDDKEKAKRKEKGGGRGERVGYVHGQVGEQVWVGRGEAASVQYLRTGREQGAITRQKRKNERKRRAAPRKAGEHRRCSFRKEHLG